MKQKRIYAWRPCCQGSAAAYAALVAVGAVWLLPGDPTTLNTILTAALCIGAMAYLAAVYLKYGRDYPGRRNGGAPAPGRQETIIPISQVAFASL